MNLKNTFIILFALGILALPAFAQQEGDIVISEYANDTGVNPNIEMVELMVVHGPLDIRNWFITQNDPQTGKDSLINPGLQATLVFQNNAAWQALPSGTIIRLNLGDSAAIAQAAYTNKTTLDQKAGDYLLVQSYKVAAGFLMNANTPRWDMPSTGGDNILLAWDDDGDSRNGYVTAIDAIYYGSPDSTYANDPHGPTSVTRVGDVNLDNGHYINLSDLTDLGNNNAANWQVAGDYLSIGQGSYGLPNKDKDNVSTVQDLSIYRGTFDVASSVSLPNYAGTGSENITVKWVAPAGYSTLVNNFYVVVSSVSGIETPADPNVSGLTADAAYGSGSAWGANSFLVYKGDGDSVNVTGLTGGAENYYVQVWTVKDDYLYYTDTYTTYNGDNSALPVELTSFNAEANATGVVLTWNTATEVNNYGFYVERKAEGSSQWENLGFVAGSGNSNAPKSYTFSDSKLSKGNFSYRLKQVDFDGKFEYSAAAEVSYAGESKFALAQNYPNPFNPTTNIRFSIPNAGSVKLVVYNVIGEKVAELINQSLEAGEHMVKFDGSKFRSGIYFYKLEANGFTQINKMLLIK